MPIGKFEPPHAIRILRRIRQTLRSGDTLLFGTDFVLDSWLGSNPIRLPASLSMRIGPTGACLITAQLTTTVSHDPAVRELLNLS